MFSFLNIFFIRDQLFDEKELGEEEIDEKISSLVGDEVKAQLVHTAWKERNEGLQALFNVCR